MNDYFSQYALFLADAATLGVAVIALLAALVALDQVLNQLLSWTCGDIALLKISFALQKYCSYYRSRFNTLICSNDISGIDIIVTFMMEDGPIKQITFSPGTPPDNFSPADITNLSVSGPTTSSLSLSWTSPGDDGNTGTASYYDVRYSTSTINDSNWNSATQVIGEPIPSSSGSLESMTVAGLSAGTNYYFAIKTSDEVPNISGLPMLPVDQLPIFLKRTI